MATTIQSASTLPSGKAAVLAKNDNDVVIVAAVRSAMTKVPHEAFYPVSLADILFTEQAWWFQGHTPRGDPFRHPSCSLHQGQPRPGTYRGYQRWKRPSSWRWRNRSSYGRSPRWHPHLYIYRDCQPSVLVWSYRRQPDRDTDNGGTDRHWYWCVVTFLPQQTSNLMLQVPESSL